MASKKYILLAGIFCLLFSSAFSQAQIRSYEDSSVIPAKRMPQHTEFMDGTNNFPAKPRNQWEIGIKGGMFRVSGDVPAEFAPGFGLHVRKAFGYVFSMRLEYMYGTGKGLDWTANQNSAKNAAWQGSTVATRYSAPYRAANGAVISTWLLLAVVLLRHLILFITITKQKFRICRSQGVITLNNIRFHKAKTGFNFYGFGGVGGNGL